MKARKHPPSLLDKFFRDKHGKIVTGQAPNLPEIAWIVFFSLSHLFHDGHLRSGLSFIGSAFLFTWAYMEIRHGASYFRRALGLVILFWVVVAHFK